MSEAEIYEAYTGLASLGATATAIYLSLVSAYLVGAYAVGKNLTRIQLVIVNSLFAITSTWHAFSSAVSGYNAVLMMNRLDSDDSEVFANTLFFGWLGVLMIGILASLYFMHTTRRANEEAT